MSPVLANHVLAFVRPGWPITRWRPAIKCVIMEWEIMMHLLAQGLANYQNWFWPSVLLFVCTIAIASGTLSHLEITAFCTLLSKWINISLFPSLFTFERHLQTRHMSKVSSKTGQFESQRRVLRLVSYFYLTSRHTNISFGHYKRGLHICVFIVQPTRHLLIILKPQSQILRCWLGTINGRASKVLIWTIYGEKI